MREAWATFAVAACALALFCLWRGLTQAAETVEAPTPSELREGLWNDGRASFADISLFDVFLPREFSRGYRPEQPIKYNHQVHVEKSGIECQYCHSSVAKSAYATVPSLESCMGCHKLDMVKKESRDVELMRQYFKEQRPIEWVPVNNLPEHVHFTHERHIKAGVGCQMCHGQIQKMAVVEKLSGLKMGFCISCHREQGASIDCLTCHH